MHAKLKVKREEPLTRIWRLICGQVNGIMTTSEWFDNVGKEWFLF
jgi:hypothetical protein